MGVVDGKVAIVTGGGRGIGRAVAKVLVNDVGAGLDGSGLDATPGQQVVDEIQAAGGAAALSTLSISEPLNGELIVQSALDAFGRVDILINNAGILRDAIFHKMSWEDWYEVVQVHLHGSFIMSRAVAGRFRQQGGGAFVHMTSTSALIGNFGQANYMAAKLGIVGLSRAIALDMQRFNVRSNCVAPFASGRMVDSLPTRTATERRRVERLRQLTPDKVAALVVFLASDRAKALTGQIFCARNNEIFLFDQPRPVRAMHRGEGWTPELLALQLDPVFGPALTPLERSADVYTSTPA